jgi:hypothetical protein
LKKQKEAAHKNKDKAEEERLQKILDRRAQFRSARKEALQAANNLSSGERISVRAAIAAYGEEGKGGPTVGVNTSPDAEAGATFVDGNQVVISFSEAEFASNTLFASVAHEGTHVRHANYWLAGGLQTLDNNISVYGTEFAAYEVGTRAVRGSGKYSSYSTGGIELWNESWAAADRDANTAAAINRHLNARGRGADSPVGKDYAWPGRKVPY